MTHKNFNLIFFKQNMLTLLKPEPWTWYIYTKGLNFLSAVAFNLFLISTCLALVLRHGTISERNCFVTWATLKDFGKLCECNPRLIENQRLWSYWVFVGSCATLKDFGKLFVILARLTEWKSKVLAVLGFSWVIN